MIHKSTSISEGTGGVIRMTTLLRREMTPGEIGRRSVLAPVFVPRTDDPTIGERLCGEIARSGGLLVASDAYELSRGLVVGRPH